MTGTRKRPNPSSCTPSPWEGPPEPLWSAPLHRSLELSNFALMFATGSGFWVPARPVTSRSQGAVPRGMGTWRAVHAPCPCLQHSRTALTCSKSRGCPGHCPHQQDLQVGSQGQTLGTCQVATTSLVAGTRNLSSGSPGVAGTCGLRTSQNQRALPLTDAGVSLIPGGTVEMAFGTHSLPWCTQSLLWTTDLLV